jgi:hypothetical protein
VAKQPPGRQAPRQTLHERQQRVRPQVVPTLPRRVVNSPDKQRCAVFIDSENLSGSVETEALPGDLIQLIWDYARKQGRVAFVQAYEGATVRDDV